MNKPLGTQGSDTHTTGQGEQILDEGSTPHTHSSAGQIQTLRNGISVVTEKRSLIPEDCSSQRCPDVGSLTAHHETIDYANSIASIDRPPSEAEDLPPAKIYRPLSIHVL